MDAAAKLTSKGQATVPKAVREALGLKEGDEVLFHVEGNRAVLARTPDFLFELAGSMPVPAAKRNVAWDEVIRRRPALLVRPSAHERFRRHQHLRPSPHRRPASSMAARARRAYLASADELFLADLILAEDGVRARVVLRGSPTAGRGGDCVPLFIAYDSIRHGRPGAAPSSDRSLRDRSTGLRRGIPRRLRRAIRCRRGRIVRPVHRSRHDCSTHRARGA